MCRWSTGSGSAHGPICSSNTLAPVIAAASLKVFDLIEHGDGLRQRLYDNARHFRTEMTKLGFRLAGEGHPIIPSCSAMQRSPRRWPRRMLDKGSYVVGFSFPVVSKGQARIRTQMSAAHSRAVSTRPCVFAEVAASLA